MVTKVKKWGNSLAIRLPKEAVHIFNIEDGTDISIEIVQKKGEITLRPQHRKVPTLDELIAGITPENLHLETDWGKPVGNEFW